MSDLVCPQKLPFHLADVEETEDALKNTQAMANHELPKRVLKPGHCLPLGMTFTII